MPIKNYLPYYPFHLYIYYPTSWTSLSSIMCNIWLLTFLFDIFTPICSLPFLHFYYYLDFVASVTLLSTSLIVDRWRRGISYHLNLGNTLMHGNKDNIRCSSYHEGILNALPIPFNVIRWLFISMCAAFLCFFVSNYWIRSSRWFHPFNSQNLQLWWKRLTSDQICTAHNSKQEKLRTNSTFTLLLFSKS